MPELPEVETVMQGVKPFLEGALIEDVIVRQAQLRWPVPIDLAAQLVHGQIGRLSRRAKYLLIPVAHGTLIVHLGMSGSLRVLPEHTPAKQHDHVDIILSGNRLLRYTDPRRFGAVLWTSDDPLAHPLLRSLGPEPLSEAFNADTLFQLASQRRVAIKSFLMNSHHVVGIGNIYVAEALFLAKIHPETAAGQLTKPEWRRLVEQIQAVLRAAIAKGGSTIKDFTNSEGKPGYFAQSLHVYGRAGLPCTQCQAPLQSIKIGQRSTVFCGGCQIKR